MSIQDLKKFSAVLLYNLPVKIKYFTAMFLKAISDCACFDNTTQVLDN